MKAGPLALVLLAGCFGSAADHERLGDTSYQQGDFAAALSEYRAAVRDKTNAGAWAKLGAAALKAGDFREATEAYRTLAQVDPTRVSEAARGLELVVRATDRAGATQGLQESVDALRRLAPERVNPRFTIALVRGGRLEPAEAAGIGPLVLAASGDAASVDQMLIQYATALQSTTACAEAGEIFAAALRRSHDPAVRARAIEGIGGCGVQQGLEALLVGHPEVAQQWFSRVIDVDSSSESGRRALLGLGDARIAQGDLLGATIAYQAAIRPGASDSIVALGTERLGRLGARAATADSA
ncbi:MAG TPA: tetratricopeptide repeat protein [Gemmatimonadales bacterium]